MNRLYQSNSFSIAYDVAGVGTPVVLLHGFGEDATIFQHQKDFLKGKCKLIALNLPGTGNSIVDYSTANATVEYLAEVVNELLNHLEIEKCILLGHSMGGYITLAFAELFPDKLMSFGLIHSTAFADSEEKKINRLKGIDIMKEYGAAAFLKTTFPNLFSNEFKKTQHPLLETLISQFSYITTDACVYYYQAMIARTDKTNLLRTAAVPVLFVIGEEDIAAPMADVLQQAYLPAVSYVHILKNVGHMSMVEAPEKLNAILEEFILFSK